MNQKVLNRAIYGVLLCIALFSAWQAREQEPSSIGDSAASNQQLASAFENKLSDVQLGGTGVVKKLLSDDLKGSRHQRFILRLASGQSLLVAHNIDLAPKIDTLKVGDTVAFYGEYEWTDRGGVMHWTHRDPASRHPHGWLEHQGRRYQ